MKMKNILVALITLFLSSISFANDKEHRAQLAQKAYEKGDFLEAIKHYESIASQGFESFELYYNLGNAYFKASSYPQAILNYERANRIDPLDEDLAFNLQLANNYQIDELNVVPELGIRSWFKSFVLSLSAGVWGIISLMFFLLTLGGILTILLKQEYKKIGFITSPIFFVLFIFFLFLGNRAIKYTEKHDSAIVMSASVTVKSVPGSSGSDLFVIHNGLKLKVLEAENNWFKIKLPDGNVGWLEKSSLEII